MYFFFDIFQTGYTKVANLLLDHGSSVNPVNFFGQTPLDRAVQGRGGETMKKLLEDFGGLQMQENGMLLLLLLVFDLSL